MYPGDDLVVADRRAVVLLSGGIDSCVMTALLLANGWEIHPLLIEYGQRHAIELEAADEMVDHWRRHGFRVEPARQVSIPAPRSVLTDESAKPPDVLTLEELRQQEISDYYVPGRNGLFLAIALSTAQAQGIPFVFIGATLTDYAAFPDCRPEWFAHWNELAPLQGPLCEVRHPLTSMRKEDVVQLGADLPRNAHPEIVPWQYATTCYHAKAVGHGCGRCPSCMERREAFEARGINDPGVYPPA